MGRGDYLGEFEQVVLLAVARLGADAYGMRIRAEIAERAGRASTIGAVYATLERLRPRDGYAGRQRAVGAGTPVLHDHSGGQVRTRKRTRRAGAHVGGPEDSRPSKAMTPPAFPRWLLRRAAPPEDRAALIGDLDEEFCTRSANDGGKASAWYWRQALASVPSALRLRWQRAAPTSDVTGDLRRALRTIRRQPGFAVAAIGTMALGSGITTAVVSIAEAILIRPLPYANAERVLVIEEHDLTRRGRGFSWPDFVELSAGRHTVSNLAGFSGGSRTLTGLGSVERLPAIEVTPQFFDVL